jgi:hypothetical protein
MSLDRPQARIPIAYVTIDGKRHECEISMPWYRLHQTIFDALGGTTSAGTPDLDSALQFDVREADVAELAKRVIDLETNVWDAPSHAQVAQLFAKVADLDQPDTAILQAQVSELSKRVIELESDLSAMCGLQAQVATLSAQIIALQNEGCFV